jgi:hypothetical protein
MTRAQEIDVPPVPRWHPSVAVTTGAGYKDNVLLSHFNGEESAFIKSGLEFFLLRLPEEGPEFHLTLTGDDVRYLKSDSIEKEQLAFGHANISQIFGNNWKASLGLEGVYLDQVLDVSIIETNLVSLKVQGEQLKATPGITRDFAELGAVELTFPFSRQWYSAPIDDLWEYGPSLSFIRPYGHESEWRLSFVYSRRDYDNRPRTEEDGTPIPGTTIALNQHHVDFVWRHHFDAERRWRATTKLSYKLNQDNGSGYFDYLRFQAGQQIRYRTKAWEISGEARVGYYDYVIQRVGGDGPVRERAELRFIARVERQFTGWLRAFGEYEFEQTLANQDIEEYSVNVVTAGLMWEF